MSIAAEAVAAVCFVFISLFLFHWYEKWETGNIKIHVIEGSFVDHYSNQPRGISVHRQRHKSPQDVFLDSKTEWLGDAGESHPGGYIEYYWGRYRRPIRNVDFHVEGQSSWVASTLIDLSIHQQVNIHVVTKTHFIWIGMSDRLFDAHAYMVVVERKNWKDRINFHRRKYIPVNVNFSISSVHGCSHFESREVHWENVTITPSSHFSICYEEDQVEKEMKEKAKERDISQFDYKLTGSWRAYGNIIMQNTSIELSVKKVHESLVVVMPLEGLDPSYQHRECGAMATASLHHPHETHTTEGMACFEWSKTVDIAQTIIHEKCVSFNGLATIKTEHKSSSDANDHSYVVTTEMENIGLILCDGHEYRGVALLNGLWVGGHFFHLHLASIHKQTGSDVWHIQNAHSSDEKTSLFELEFRSRGKPLAPGKAFGVFNGTVHYIDHHEKKEVEIQNLVGAFEDTHDVNPGWW